MGARLFILVFEGELSNIFVILTKNFYNCFANLFERVDSFCDFFVAMFWTLCGEGEWLVFLQGRKRGTKRLFEISKDRTADRRMPLFGVHLFISSSDFISSDSSY